ncbi:conserved hypothetical protein [Gammaproteobacteria bacterium]
MIMAKLVLIAVIATAKNTINKAGSAIVEINISREEPMPPKAVPVSMPASAKKNRAKANKPTMTITSAIAVVGVFIISNGTTAQIKIVILKIIYGAMRNNCEVVVAINTSLRNSLFKLR